jgi:ABC-type phosphate/phosphonate transport system substrate-binding protein
MTVPPAPIASLPMYDWPELQAANDALWSGIAGRLGDFGVAHAPAQLTRTGDLDGLWTSPALLLAQTCGYPLVTRLGGRVQLVATPCYRAAGCEGPFRRSAIVVRAEGAARRLADLHGARCALNDAASDSGMNLLRAAVAPLARGAAFFSEVVVTGSHLASAEAVAEGAADVAALDAVSYAHLRRLRPQVARRLRLLQWSAPTPGLPLITAAGADAATVAALRAALAAVARDPALAEARETLLLEGFSPLALSDYRVTRQLEERAHELGYPTLR